MLRKIFLALTCLLHSAISRADDWPQWLGQRRDGVWREAGIIRRFPEGGPKLRWKVSVSGGYSSPVVADGRVFVTDWTAKPQSETPKNLNGGAIPKNQNFVRELHPGMESVRCFRESDGKLIWQHEYDCSYTTVSTYAIGPRCSPTVDGEFVYTLGSEGHLLCLKVSTGDVLWSRDFVKQDNAKVPFWGFAAHPLIDGDRLICVSGGKAGVCVALNKFTGDVLWQSLSAKEPGYCAPVIYEVAGRRQLIVWHSDSVNGLDPSTGEVFWSVPFQATFAMSIGMPRLEGNRLFIMCFSRQCAAIDIAKDGRSATIAWRGNSRRGIGGVHNTPVLVNGYIYGCDNGGRYTCAGLRTGERLWTSYAPSSAERPLHWGNVFTIRQANRFFLANDKGDLIIARLSPDGYEELSKAHLIEPTHKVGPRMLVWSHPAFANRSVYLRNDQEMRCYSLAAE